MDNNIKSNTSFWSEISDYKIQVPYYQRDYAQGRIDNGRIDNIRKVFVEEMYRAIMGSNNNECHLGLVFGSYDENEKVFIAVDGQQRLTTVFLLHWYVAWRENKLNDYKEKLLNFSWDTRSYSSQFVELLFKIQPSGNVIDSIKTNSNYFSVWENDPTVKGMLTMLEEIEKQYPNDMVLCSQLFSNDCEIKYDILKLEKDSDGKTYLKMNSRGRSLTTFELFKSKFLDKYKPNFGHKFDNEWLSFMIKFCTTSDSKFPDPDIPFMNFINEYTYMQLKLKSGSDIANNYKEFTDAKVKGELTDVPFISFDKYNCAFEGDRLEYFEKSLDWIYQNYENIKLIDNKIRFSDSRFFIDAIIQDNNPNFTHRAKLFAVFKYAELTGYNQIDTELYEKWTRVFRNLVANTDIDGSNIGGICKAINKIDNSDIYGYLSNGGEISAFTKDQVAEEIAKAKQILNENGTLRKYVGSCKKSDGSNYQTWEEIIIDAEKYAFFKGAIRFLFQNEKGELGLDESKTWNTKNFDTKWENAQKYFKMIPEQKNVMNKEYDNTNLLKALISRFTQQNYWDVLNYYYRVFNNSLATWRYYLLNDKINSPVHEIMMGNNNIQKLETSQDEAQKRLYQLSNTDLLDFVIDKIPQSWIRNYHGHIAIFPSSTGVFLNAEKRDKLLTTTLGIDIRHDHIIPNTTLLFGSDINFTFNKYNFQWYRNDFLYLMEKDQFKKYMIKDENAKEDTDKYFCFNTQIIDDSNHLIQKLKDLIDESSNEHYEA